MLYLKPVLPQTAAAAEQFLNITPMDWSDAGQPLLDHELNAFKPLVTRVDPAAIDAMVSESQHSLKPT
jgi:methionyl-tRNA synthetase